jgi:hypothetical protein
MFKKPSKLVFSFEMGSFINFQECSDDTTALEIFPTSAWDTHP